MSRATRPPVLRLRNCAPSLLAAKCARDGVLAFVFEGNALTDAAVSLGAIEIPMYTSYVSMFDPHPNSEGAEQIAASMRDTVVEFVGRVCSERTAV